jgi:hypothetical protein
MHRQTMLSERFGSFARTTDGRAPLYAVLAASVAADPALLALLDPAPDEQAIPVLLFAAVHDLLLADPTHQLARYYPSLGGTADHSDAFTEFRSFALDRADEIGAIVATRNTQTNEVGRCALLLPALGLVADECGELALVDVGASAGLTLLLDRYSYRYEPMGLELGPHSTVHLECSVRGPVPLADSIPRITAAVGLDAQPIDVTDPDACRWLEACVWPDQADRFRRLVAALEIARSSPPDVRQGDAVDDVGSLVDQVGASGHPVVVNTWVLNYLPLERRLAYVAELDRIGATRDLSWVMAESPAETVGLPIPTTEPPEELTVVSIVRWRNGQRHAQRLAACHPHGYWMQERSRPA